MKITCPNCQKNYRINEAKIPAGVTGVGCKACGNKIPLKTTAAPKPASDSALIKRSCPYCGQNHALRSSQIPPGARTIKCKSCSRPVPLKLETAAEDGLVHSLKKETSEPPTDSPSLKAAMSPSQQPEFIILSCGSCSKKYKIPAKKIPPSAKALKCKSCGQRIALPEPEKISEKPVPVPAAMPLPARKSQKSWGLYALAAGILLTVLIGAFTGLKIYTNRGPDQVAKPSPEQLAESAALLQREPFAVLNLNVPLVLKTIDQHADKNKKTLKFKTTISLVKSLKLEWLQVFLYAAPDRQILPVLLARGKNARHLEKVFSGRETLKKYLERQSAGKYRLKKEALEKPNNYSLPEEPYQVSLIGKDAVLAPLSLSGAITGNKNLLLDTGLVRFGQSIANPDDLARVAIRIPEDLKKGWEKRVTKSPALENNPQAAMMLGMGAAILSRLTDSLKPIEILAMGFRFEGKNGRALSYAQQFRPGVDGNAIYRQLNSEDLERVEIDGVIRALIGLFQDPRYSHKLHFADNRLGLELSWSKEDDEIFLAALSGATFGQLFAGSMELTPTTGPVTAEYTDEPLLFTTVDSKSLKPRIPQIVKQSIFPGNYYNYGENPRMTLDLDPLNIPNAALAELTYDVVSIQAPDASNILRVEENQFKPAIKPGSRFPGNLSLAIQNGTPPESLGSATIQFLLKLPDALQVFEFRNGDQKGNSKKAGELQVALKRLEKDVAEVTHTRGKSVHLIAYDRTGKALASRESVSSPSSVSRRFQGMIDTLKVVVAASMLECPFEIKVDLNGGKELKLARKPEIPVRTRYNHRPVKNFSNFSAADLEDLAVAWQEAGERDWADKLEILLHKGPFSGQAEWEVHFFGRNRPHFLSGNPIQGAKGISYQLEKGRLAGVSAAFGSVRLSINTDIKRLSFKNKKGGKPQSRRLASGETVTVSFNKNEISYTAGKAPVIQVMAYDSFGKRLKQGSYSGRKAGKYTIYFWGQPARFEIDLATRTLKRTIPFNIKQRPVDDRALQAYKRTIDNQRHIVATLKSVDRARRRDRSYYGDDLAGLYYLYGRKSKKPMRLFDKKIAHSDPAGQDRFGYKAKPYQGYYFTVLSGSKANGTQKKYNRRSKKTNFVWKKGKVATFPLTRYPDLVAMPSDKNQPTFFLQWGHVYMKPLNGKRLNYVPENYYNTGWREAKFIEG